MRKKRGALLSVLLVVILSSGCSTMASLATDAVLAQDKGLSVDANVAKGDAEGEKSTAQNANTAVSVGANKETIQSFESPVAQVVNEAGLGWKELVLIVLLAGWAIPSPAEMVKGFVDMLPGRKRRRRL